MIHVGDDAHGTRIQIPVFHTGIFAKSGVGKTVLSKYMIEQANAEGYRVLIFDSKLTKPQFEGIGVEIPFYLKESTDPDVYRSLLEGIRAKEKGDLHRYRPAFVAICDPNDTEEKDEDGKKRIVKGTPAKSFAEIGERLQAKLADFSRIKGTTRQMYDEIYRDHRTLMEALAENEFTPDLEATIKSTDAPVLRMAVRKLPNLSLEGLIVGSVAEEMLTWEGRHGKWILLVDEAPNFVHQKRFSPAKRPLGQVDSQGRDVSLFGWYTAQTISGFDKEGMKNIDNWILGREMERNERLTIYDTVTQTDPIPGKSREDKVRYIQMMKRREFLVSTPEGTSLVMVPELDEIALNASLSIRPKIPKREGANWKMPFEPEESTEDWTPVARAWREVREKAEEALA